MRYIPITIDEVLEWLDVFTSITELPPSLAAMVYSELLHCPKPTLIFLEASQKELGLGVLQASDPDAFKEQMGLFEASCDQNLRESDDDTYIERMDHYASVLTYHGFSEIFIDAFLEHISPSSDSRPYHFEIDEDELYEDGDFNPEPYFTITGCEDSEEGIDPSALQAMGQHMEGHQRLQKPVDPVGWVALMSKLGFEVVKDTIAKEYSVGTPSFYIAEKFRKPVPVFIVGATRTAFDQDDQAGHIVKALIQDHLRLNYGERALLFYGSPSVITDDKEMKEGLVFWGEVYWDSMWGEMILHQGTHSTDKIISDSMVVSLGLNSFEKAPYKDRGLELMNLWMENHAFAV